MRLADSGGNITAWSTFELDVLPVNAKVPDLMTFRISLLSMLYTYM